MVIVKSQQSISEQQGKTHIVARYYSEGHGACSNGYCSLYRPMFRNVWVVTRRSKWIACRIFAACFFMKRVMFFFQYRECRLADHWFIEQVAY